MTVADLLNPVLLPVIVGLALVIAIAGSTPAIRKALSVDPSQILRAGA
jgi:putative ABC transport system permease protein